VSLREYLVSPFFTLCVATFANAVAGATCLWLIRETNRRIDWLIRETSLRLDHWGK
jgi:hypothetical protein